MVIRLFRCHDCGHRMRLFGPRCGRCYTQKRPYQRVGFYFAICVLPAVAAGVTLAAI